jgi:parvulin-like peptidyl-prolyl isomerase
MNGKPVTAAEFREMIAVMPADVRATAMRDPENFFKQYAHFRTILDIAQKEHLTEQSPYKERLIEMQRQWTVNARIEKVKEEFKLSPHDQRAWYDAHADDFKATKAKVLAIGFSAAGAKDAKSRTEEDARGIANGIVQKARLGADFAELVRAYSEDQRTREAGGDLPRPVRASSREIPDAIRNPILKLKTGQVSDPIRVESGFYIIKATFVGPLPYDEVKDEIFTTLQNAAVQKFLDETKKQSNFKIENAEFFKPGQPANK